ncbi:MAG: hypothetical protein ACR2FL_03035 [Nocardioidaceae bacterium]
MTTMRFRLATAMLLLAATVGCSEQTDALREAEERVSEESQRLDSELAQARRDLEALAPDLRTEADRGLERAAQATTEAQQALDNAGGQLDDAARRELQRGEGQLAAAEEDIRAITPALPQQVQGAFEDVQQRLASLRDRVEKALGG